MADYRVDEHGDRVWMTEAECGRWDAFARRQKDLEEMRTKYITTPRLLTSDQLSGARAHLQVNAVDFDHVWQVLEDDAGLSSSLDFAAALVGLRDEADRLQEGWDECRRLLAEARKTHIGDLKDALAGFNRLTREDGEGS